MVQLCFTDQLLRQIRINFPPKRIISLVPSQTELLFDLGLDEEIIGITQFCNHPKYLLKSKVKIGGTKTLNINLIRSLNPDLIIGNKEENDQSQIETLMQHHAVWMSDIVDLNGALAMIKGLGDVVSRKTEARLIAHQTRKKFDLLNNPIKNLNVVYLIWQNPYMAAGGNTFINDMLQRCGWLNSIKVERYPEVNINDMSKADVIMLSSEPYPFRQKHSDAIKILCPNSKVMLVDGEMFSWYGSRMLKAVDYFQTLIRELNNELI